LSHDGLYDAVAAAMMAMSPVVIGLAPAATEATEATEALDPPMSASGKAMRLKISSIEGEDKGKKKEKKEKKKEKEKEKTLVSPMISRMTKHKSLLLIMRPEVSI
jgi:hypothetical protein